MFPQPTKTTLPQELPQATFKKTCLHLRGCWSDDESESSHDYDRVIVDDYKDPGDMSDPEENSSDADDSQYDANDEREDDQVFVDDERRSENSEGGSGDYCEDDDRDYSL